MAGILGKGLEWWIGAVIGYFLLGKFVTNIVSDVLGAATGALNQVSSGYARKRTYISYNYR